VPRVRALDTIADDNPIAALRTRGSLRNCAVADTGTSPRTTVNPCLRISSKDGAASSFGVKLERASLAARRRLNVIGA
jgi:hypothetical protein